MTRTDNKKAVYVLFTDDRKSAEFAIPECKLIRNDGFAADEIDQLMQYVKNEQDSILDVAKGINPLKAFMGK
ncbi:MAG: hypothetical protein K6G69_10930 [Lachnospiraceae bacterium]|nr:hypothetical protein [Lachnospiraceae bacterium]